MGEAALYQALHRSTKDRMGSESDRVSVFTSLLTCDWIKMWCSKPRLMVETLLFIVVLSYDCVANRKSW